MKKAVLFLLFSFSACRVGSDEVNSNGDQAKKLNILMVSDHLLGHLAPMLPLGEELAQRGHNVTMLLVLQENQQEKYKRHIEKYGVHLWNVSSEDLPELDLVQTVQNRSGNFIGKLMDLGGYALGLFSIMAKHMNKSLSANDFDFVIAYFFQQSLASCMHSVHNVPTVVVGHTPIAFHLYPAWPWPGVMHGVASDNMGFLDRAWSVPSYLAVVAGNIIVGSAMMYAISEYCPTVSVIKAMTDPGIQIPAIVHSVIGFEYPCTVTPLTEYVGPLLSPHPPPLTEELGEWLEKKSDQSVVYISMGSMFNLDEKTGRAFLKGVMNTNLSVLWSLKKSNQVMLEDIDIDTDRVMISDWTPQFSVLQSPAIHSAIVHGGINGLSEAFWNGVPVIVVPLMIEQMLSAGRVHFNGLGIHLDSRTLSSDKITVSLKALDSGNYRSKVSQLKKMYGLAGGVKRAADLVEFYEDVGYAHLVPAYAKYQWSWVQYYNADVYTAILLIVVAITMSFLGCCRCLCRKCSGATTKQKKE